MLKDTAARTRLTQIRLSLARREEEWLSGWITSTVAKGGKPCGIHLFKLKISGVMPLRLENPRPGHRVLRGWGAAVTGACGWWECGTGPAMLVNSLAFSQAVTHLPWPAGVLLLSVYPRVMKMYVNTKTRVWPFTAALSKIMPNWTRHKCLSAGAWGRELGHTPMMKYCSVWKRSQPVIHTTEGVSQIYAGEWKEPDSWAL